MKDETMKLSTLTLSVLAATATATFAEPLILTIGSGGKAGTYYPVMSEIAGVCNSDSLFIQHRLDAEGNSIGGSDNNLRGILRNEIPAGIIQLDKAYFELQVNPDMPRVQALLPLHEEPVHVLVPTEVSVLKQEAVEPNFLGFGGKEAVFETETNSMRDISDLQGQTVVAWGGSLTSAKIVSQLAKLNLDIIEVKDEVEAIDAVRTGAAAAIVATVGFPAAWIEALPDGEFSILEATDVAEDVEAVYSLSGVSYDNLGQSGQAVQALSVDAILFTRKFDKPEMVAALAELQSCVRENITEFRDTLGTHPAWQRIDPDRDMKWSNLFIAPKAAVVAPATAADGG
ncbi:transporter substrate-binding domain-containing protein [Patescibacteria group bacterium]|nr:transporter substrate-binding domain-containing protein [Patescibacteria group bacterium]